MKHRCNKITIVVLNILIVGAILVMSVAYSDESDDIAGLKRLFYTNTERQKIDISRKKISVKTPNSEPISSLSNAENSPIKKNIAIKHETVTIEGYIQREDGKNVVWFNDTSTLKQNNDNSNFKIKSESIGKEGIDIVSNKKKLRLKPGQVLEISSGIITENYELKDSSAISKAEKQ